MMDKEKFEMARKRVLKGTKVTSGIGTLKEGSLHAVLKNYIEPDTSCHEVKIGKFVADIVKDNNIIEIQTRSFSNLRKKLEFFLQDHHVKIVYPIAYIKWLSWIDLETGEVSSKRKSPKKGVPHEIFFELYRIKNILVHPNLSLCIVLLNIEEYKLLNGWDKDKKKGACRKDRIPVEIVDEMHINNLKDYREFIPFELGDGFTSKDFKMHTKLSLKSAQTALNVLTFVGAVKRIGKKGNTYIYKRGETE